MSRPYFETKVVKVKKERYKINRSLYCPCCNSKLEAEKPKGNWVNGENLDKIKFPCFCTHKEKSDGYTGYGMIIRELGEGTREKYVLVDIGEQHNCEEGLDTVSSNCSLKDLINIWDIHILKGKIIIFEEGEDNE